MSGSPQPPCARTCWTGCLQVGGPSLQVIPVGSSQVTGARLRGLKRPDVISPVPEGCVKSRGSQGAGCGRERRRERTRGHGAPKPKPTPRGGTWGGAAPAGGWCMWRGGRAKGGEVPREGGEAHRPRAGAQLVLSVFPGGAGAPVAPWAQGTRRTMKSDWGPLVPLVCPVPRSP